LRKQSSVEPAGARRSQRRIAASLDVFGNPYLTGAAVKVGTCAKLGFNNPIDMQLNRPLGEHHETSKQNVP